MLTQVKSEAKIDMFLWFGNVKNAVLKYSLLVVLANIMGLEAMMSIGLCIGCSPQQSIGYGYLSSIFGLWDWLQKNRANPINIGLVPQA